MKHKNKIIEQEDLPLLEKTRKKLKTVPKSKFSKKIRRDQEGPVGRPRKRIQDAKPRGYYDDEWDEDDQLLYQWRRRGEVEPVDDVGDEEIAEEVTEEKTVSDSS